ncbi:MAG: flagellar cap protein [Firmicutes bacterium HGW-Firmicutes-12]|nr:MAG: flagellar cap protein [Firmicutes bacterium HGW-Firmicutes-12]
MVNTNLRVGGLSSGIDTDSIVKDLMKVAKAPLNNKMKSKQVWTWKQEDYRSINLNLLSLKNKAFNMKLQSPYLAKQVTTEDSDIVTATAVSSAAKGTYSIKVAQLAEVAINASTGAISSTADDKIDTSKSILSQAYKLSNAGTFFDGKLAEDTFTVTVNDEEFTFSYGDSLDKITSTINNSDDAAISMFYDSATDKLALSSAGTGSSAGLELTGVFFSSVIKIDNNQMTAGKDAEFELNGLQTSRSGNSFTINGVTFDLKGLTSGGLTGSATKVEVKQDTDAVYKSIVDFVDQYNEIYETISEKLSEKTYSTYGALTDEEKESLSETEIEKWEEKAKSGLLKNDPIMRGLLTNMRTSISKTVKGVDGYSSLAEIGITTGNYWDGNGGKLVIDESKLRTVLEENTEGVAQLFNNDSDTAGEEGVAARLYDTITETIGRITSYAGSSSNLYDKSYISRTMRDLDDQIYSLEDRLTRLEDRYWRQFTAMETAISSMNQQSSWLTNMLAGAQGS